ncbi:hypothetical protein ACFLW5_00990 [Chloroflexota bacterium]
MVDSLLRNTPELVAWLVGIVLAVLMVRRGGARAEKLLLTGCSFMFASKLASPFLSEFITRLMSEKEMSNIATAQTMGLARLLLAILGIAGFVCLVWAFWTRFRKVRMEAA